MTTRTIVYITFAFFLLLNNSTFAQSPTDTIIYHQGQDTFDLASANEIPFAAYTPTPAPRKGSLLLWTNSDTVLVDVALQAGTNTGSLSGTLAVPFLELTSATDLGLGNAWVTQLIEQQDSIVQVNTQLLLAPNPTGVFYLDFRQGNGALDSFMTLATYNYWIQQNNLYSDSLTAARQDIRRAEQMVNAATETVQQQKAIADKAQKKLDKHTQYQAEFDEIATVSKQVNEGLERVKDGEQLTTAEMMAIADATGTRQKVGRALEEKSPQAYQDFYQHQTATERQARAEQQLQAAQELLKQRAAQIPIYNKKIATATKKIAYFERLYKDK